MPADEFTSSLFPLLVAKERGAVVREVAFDDLAASIVPATTLVAFSLVQMQTGKVADLEAITAAAGRHGARVMIDATQAIPFVAARRRHRPDRLSRLLGLQAPAVAARHGLLLRPARPLGRARATERQLARGGPAVRPLLRRTADAGTGRAPVRRLARLVPVGRRDRVAAPAHRVAGRRRVRRRARPRLRPGRPAGRAVVRRLARLCADRRRRGGPRRAARRPASRHRSAAPRSASRSTSTTPRPTSTAPRRPSRRSPAADSRSSVRSPAAADDAPASQEDVERIAEHREVGERIAGDHEEIRRSTRLEAAGDVGHADRSG